MVDNLSGNPFLPVINLAKFLVKGKSLIPEGERGAVQSLYEKYRQFYSRNNLPWDEVNIAFFRDESNMEKGAWNDKGVLLYLDKYKIGRIEEFLVTTDPSAHYTETLREWDYGNRDVNGNRQYCTGAGHLKEGFYKFKVGIHQKSYPALVQAEKFYYYADMNSYDKSKWKLCYDDGACHIHYGLGSGNRIWLASALCQVIKGLGQWKRFWSIIEQFENKSPGRTYGYLLIGIDKYREINQSLEAAA